MFRLIELYTDAGTARIGVNADGYSSEGAALRGYRAAPATVFFGVGRFNSVGSLQEIVFEPTCGATGACPRPATVVHARTFERLCGQCSTGRDVLSPDELGARLGVVVRSTSGTESNSRDARPDDTCLLSNRIGRELATHVIDPSWRADVCAQLSQAPKAINGLLIGVGALSRRDVLDLFPALRSLGTELPISIHAELVRASARPLSPAGLAALRMGL